jgi:hypothetical protein
MSSIAHTLGREAMTDHQSSSHSDQDPQQALSRYWEAAQRQVLMAPFGKDASATIWAPYQGSDCDGSAAGPLGKLLDIVESLGGDQA